jgi:hypothetical protein
MILCIKGVLPPVEWSISSFPHFLRFCKAPSRRLKIPQDYHTHECDLYNKYLVSTVTGQHGPFLTLRLFGSTNLFILHSRQRAFCHINANELDLSLLLSLFHSFLTYSDPYRIRLRCLFLERACSQRPFSQFLLCMKTSSLTQFLYLRRFHVFSTCFPHLYLPCLP